MRYMYVVAMVTGFLEKICCNNSDISITSVSGKIQTDTINRTVFGKEFVKLVWQKWKPP